MLPISYCRYLPHQNCGFGSTNKSSLTRTHTHTPPPLIFSITTRAHILSNTPAFIYSMQCGAEDAIFRETGSKGQRLSISPIVWEKSENHVGENRRWRYAVLVFVFVCVSCLGFEFVGVVFVFVSDYIGSTVHRHSCSCMQRTPFSNLFVIHEERQFERKVMSMCDVLPFARIWLEPFRVSIQSHHSHLSTPNNTF